MHERAHAVGGGVEGVLAFALAAGAAADLPTRREERGLLGVRLAITLRVTGSAPGAGRHSATSDDEHQGSDP